MLRHRKKTLNTVKKLDAFPKIPEECIETTSTGGTFSVLGFIIILWLVVWEFIYYLDTEFKFKFKPDTDFTEKINMNLDITVAMPCKFVGADILDVTGQQVMSFGELDMEDTWWELDPHQQVQFDSMQRVNSYLREQFHSIHHFLWRSGFTNMFGALPQRTSAPNHNKDACRLHGSMLLNKVSGNFHITAGKTIPLPQGHAHLAIFMEDEDYNFTHRIEKLSFGDSSPGIIQPMEGDEQVTLTNFMSYQYFITIVPTSVNTYSHRGNTFQYSVSELSREIAHHKGSHGTPGIFFKYDVSALKIEVREEHESFIKFVTRLCGIIGGVFTVSGLISRIMGFFINCFLCKYLRETFGGSDDEEIIASVELFSASIVTSVPSTVIPTTPCSYPQPIAASTPIPVNTKPLKELKQDNT